MEKTCEIVQDLIPLVADKIASDASIQMVEEHIKHCEECNKVYSMVNRPLEVVDCKQNLEEKKVIQHVAKKQKRKILIGIATGILTTMFVVCLYCIANRGITAFTNVEIGDSIEYRSTQLNSAKEAVMRKFRQDYAGCKLLTLSYEEAFSKEYCKESDYDTANTIVFNNSFYVYPWNREGSLNTNFTYEGWTWTVQYLPVLNQWIVINWGLG